MRQDEVAAGLRELAFDFFYWFSRFEFALKENGYLVSTVMGARAQPDWDRFVVAHQDQYAPDQAAYALIEANPLRQIVGARAARRQSKTGALSERMVRKGVHA